MTASFSSKSGISDSLALGVATILSLLVIAFVASRLALEIIQPKVLGQGYILSDLDEASFRDVVTGLERTTWLPFRNSADILSLASAYQESSQREQKLDGKIGELCKALQVTGAAIAQAPLKGKSLLRWAALRKLLSNYDCGLSLTNGDPAQVAGYAIDHEPQSTSNLFAAALVFISTGDRPRALGLFKSMLTYDTTLENGRRELMFDQIVTADDVRLVIPGRFPQAIDWSAKFKEERATDFRNFASAFEAVQLEAVQQAKKYSDRGVTKTRQYQGRLLELDRVAATPAVVSAVSSEIARLSDVGVGTPFPSRKVVTDYFLRRAGLAELDVPRAGVLEDVRPQKMPLHSWNDRSGFSLDHARTSIGFYLPKGSSLALVEIKGNKDGATLDPQAIQVWSSGDNFNWTEFERPVSKTSYTLRGQNWLALEGDFSGFQYWKIHYARSDSPEAVSGKLDRLVRVFGAASSLSEEVPQ